MLSPHEIEQKKFTVVHLRSGYDQAEVDNFIDRIQADYKYLFNRFDSQSTQVLPKMKPEPVPDVTYHAGQPSEMIAKILSVAEETANKHKAEAQSKAEAVLAQANRQGVERLAEAQADASRILDNARSQAAALVQEGQDERHKVIGEMEDRRAHLKEKVDELIRVESEVTARMRNALERWNT